VKYIILKKYDSCWSFSRVCITKHGSENVILEYLFTFVSSRIEFGSLSSGKVNGISVTDCRAYPLRDFPARCQHAAAIMLMVLNNLDPQVAQFPQELVTYGGNGQVFSNWAQVRTGCAKRKELRKLKYIS
jgi:hypothetical protein